MRVSVNEFWRIRRELRTIRDIGKMQYPRGMLHCILQQKKVESVKRKYHTFADKIPEIVDFWERNKSFPKWLTLPPVMKIRLLMKGMGYSAKTINRALRDPENTVEDEQLAEKIKDAVLRDYVYSPIAARLQRARGRLGEMALAYELEKKGLEFKTERDLKGLFRKTPDFYFDEPVEFLGKKLKWIESKALFGDPLSHDLYWRKQYSKYHEMFGEGLVVYWLGCIEGLEVSDGSEFKNGYRNSLLDMLLYITDSKDEKYAERLDAVFVETNESNSILAAERIVDAYARGRVLAFTDKKREVLRILRNMGFDVVVI
ncbi:TPD domain-containing protein [Archaeoglobus neptunius]|uniref:TPD domain-containing protein n=1 Tax=Archaeoglobus neptunius TaxID=2798580 RepID=UPI0019265452|nr:TPD domain-containing protein [Archaeoglobus neptunius]